MSFDFNSLRDKGATEEMIQVLECIQTWNELLLGSKPTEQSASSQFELSTPRSLNLTSGADLFAIQPFCPDLSISRADSFKVVSDKELLGYDMPLVASELIMPLGKPPACTHVETLVCAYSPKVDLGIWCQRISGGVSLSLTQDATKRSLQVSQTLGETAKLSMGLQFGDTETHPIIPEYLVVIRYEFDLIKDKHICQITFVEVNEERFRSAVGLR